MKVCHGRTGSAQGALETFFSHFEWNMLSCNYD